MSKVKATVEVLEEIQVMIDISDISTEDLAKELKSRGCIVVDTEYLDIKMKWEAVSSKINDYSLDELHKKLEIQ